MKIAVTSEDFKRVTGHAGKSRRFVIFDVRTPSASPDVVWLDLPMEMSLYEFSGDRHPLDDMDVILTACASQRVVTRLALRGIKVVACGESDPRKAVRDYLNGTVKRANPYAHLEQERHEHAFMGHCLAS